MVAADNGHRQSSLTTLLLLADGRFPAGGHAHSGGVEPAAAYEGVRDISSLEVFLRGRVATAGAIAAAFAAAACAAFAGERMEVMEELDRELDVRIPSPVLRATSRKLGRQFLRAGRGIWRESRLGDLSSAMPQGAHQPVILGAVAAAAGLDPASAAASMAFEAVIGPATAAVRLLGLDPFAVHTVLARLGPEIDEIVATTAIYADVPPALLPAWGAPLLDLLAEQHATWEVRLFAS